MGSSGDAGTRRHKAPAIRTNARGNFTGRADASITQQGKRANK